MATLHMDTDAVRSVQSNIANVKSQIDDQATQINSMVDNMVGSTWVAQGAEQFKGEFQDWHNVLKQNLEKLQEFADRLTREVAEWEEAQRTI